MRTKNFELGSGTIENWNWRLSVEVKENETFGSRGSSFKFRDVKERAIKNKIKIQIRNSDREWVRNNIPSSIWWYTENHHEWGDGARLYLLTKAEHILRGRNRWE